MDNMTLKKTVIRTFADVSSPIGSNLLLATPFGLISGRLSTTSVPTPEELDQISGKATVEEAASVTAALLATAKSNYGDAPVNGNDGYLAFFDVVIKSSSGTTFNIGSMVVFYDQIIGISLGKFDA